MTTELLPAGVRGRQIRLEYVDGVVVGHGLKGQVVRTPDAVAVTRFDYVEFHSAARRGQGDWKRVKGLVVLDAQLRILLIVYADFDPQQTVAFTAAAGLQPGPVVDMFAPQQMVEFTAAAGLQPGPVVDVLEAEGWLGQHTTPETQRLTVDSALVGGVLCFMCVLTPLAVFGGMPLLYWLAPGLSIGILLIPLFTWMFMMVAVAKGAEVLAHRRGEVESPRSWNSRRAPIRPWQDG